jgi:hypothetical protein
MGQAELQDRGGTMQLMRAADVPQTERDLVFRASRLHAVLTVLACLAFCVWFILHTWPHPRIAYVFSGGILLFLFLLHRLVSYRFHPSNWLVRAGDEGLFIHFRSYLNDDLSPDDPTVVFLPYPEIRSVRLVRERVTKPDMNGRSTTEFQHWVELELTKDTAALVDALGTERGRPGATEKHWYGTSASLYLDYPVQMPTPPFLRVRWQVVPRVAVLFDALRPRVEIAPEVKVSEDFSSLQNLPAAEQEKRLRELNQRGQTMAAIYMARRLYGCNLTEATNFVKGLTGSQS